MLAFTDENELHVCIKLFTGTDSISKQEIINTYGDISDWNVENIRDMSYMFTNCQNFNHDISKWNVANVTTMQCMFRDCHVFNSDLSM